MGVLLIGRPSNDELTQALLEASYPTICVSYHPGNLESRSVDCDNIHGGYVAAQYLLALGHRHLLFDVTDTPSSWVEERRQGALKAFHEAGLPETNLLSLTTAPIHIDAILEHLHREQDAPTALLFNDEYGTQMVAEALPEHGFRVPEDISLITFNSTEVSERCRPPLTSVGQPLGDIGESAVEMLIDLVEGREVPFGIRRFPMHLDVRASTAPRRPD